MRLPRLASAYRRSLAELSGALSASLQLLHEVQQVQNEIRTSQSSAPALHKAAEGCDGHPADAGANVIVAGSSVFGAPDPVKAIATLRATVENRNAERRDRDAEAA